MHDRTVIIDNVTRATVDGGRDVVGRYLLGLDDDLVYANSMKQNATATIRRERATTVSVKDVVSLISRLRHRQFGALVTTSVIGRKLRKYVRTSILSYLYAAKHRRYFGQKWFQHCRTG